MHNADQEISANLKGQYAAQLPGSWSTIDMERTLTSGVDHLGAKSI